MSFKKLSLLSLLLSMSYTAIATDGVNTLRNPFNGNSELLIEPAGSLTGNGGSSNESEIIEDLEPDAQGWYPFMSYFNGGLISDEQWNYLKENMTEGVKFVRHSDSKTYFYPKEMLINDSICSDINDLNSLYEANYKDNRSIVLYHSEPINCAVVGSDYSLIYLSGHQTNITSLDYRNEFGFDKHLIRITDDSGTYYIK